MIENFDYKELTLGDPVYSKQEKRELRKIKNVLGHPKLMKYVAQGDMVTAVHEPHAKREKNKYSISRDKEVHDTMKKIGLGEENSEENAYEKSKRELAKQDETDFKKLIKKYKRESKVDYDHVENFEKQLSKKYDRYGSICSFNSIDNDIGDAEISLVDGGATTTRSRNEVPDLDLSLDLDLDIDNLEDIVKNYEVYGSEPELKNKQGRIWENEPGSKLIPGARSKACFKLSSKDPTDLKFVEHLKPKDAAQEKKETEKKKPKRLLNLAELLGGGSDDEEEDNNVVPDEGGNSLNFLDFLQKKDYKKSVLRGDDSRKSRFKRQGTNEKKNDGGKGTQGYKLGFLNEMGQLASPEETLEQHVSKERQERELRKVKLQEERDKLALNSRENKKELMGIFELISMGMESTENNKAEDGQGVKKPSLLIPEKKNSLVNHLNAKNAAKTKDERAQARKFEPDFYSTEVGDETQGRVFFSERQRDEYEKKNGPIYYKKVNKRGSMCSTDSEFEEVHEDNYGHDADPLSKQGVESYKYLLSEQIAKQRQELVNKTKWIDEVVLDVGATGEYHVSNKPEELVYKEIDEQIIRQRTPRKDKRKEGSAIKRNEEQVINKEERVFGDILTAGPLDSTNENSNHEDTNKTHTDTEKTDSNDKQRVLQISGYGIELVPLGNEESKDVETPKESYENDIIGGVVENYVGGEVISDDSKNGEKALEPERNDNEKIPGPEVDIAKYANAEQRDVAPDTGVPKEAEHTQMLGYPIGAPKEVDGVAQATAARTNSVNGKDHENMPSGDIRYKASFLDLSSDSSFDQTAANIEEDVEKSVDSGSKNKRKRKSKASKRKKSSRKSMITSLFTNRDSENKKRLDVVDSMDGRMPRAHPHSDYSSDFSMNTERDRNETDDGTGVDRHKRKSAGDALKELLFRRKSKLSYKKRSLPENISELQEDTNRAHFLKSINEDTGAKEKEPKNERDESGEYLLAQSINNGWELVGNKNEYNTDGGNDGDDESDKRNTLNETQNISSMIMAEQEVPQMKNSEEKEEEERGRQEEEGEGGVFIPRRSNPNTRNSQAYISTEDDNATLLTLNEKDGDTHDEEPSSLIDESGSHKTRNGSGVTIDYDRQKKEGKGEEGKGEEEGEEGEEMSTTTRPAYASGVGIPEHGDGVDEKTAPKKKKGLKKLFTIFGKKKGTV
ncbi:hypothetical protein AX774_g4917 [Zancudomyces culisetae]|uniref:Uncharacterized protein n=1 Tax=Zancudomyces culisetae TaxID=1213189 RepID=A0A1R1PL73_ZANCU|nr:hypothetical protein AX774_g4917 [Zancudomyces culisetae]|eukprot:OMH81622.1 hypothetical protein AX774_g4917 [Zancudomyces culisetae]